MHRALMREQFSLTRLYLVKIHLLLFWYLRHSRRARESGHLFGKHSMFAILSFRENWRKYLRPIIRRTGINKPARKKFGRGHKIKIPRGPWESRKTWSRERRLKLRDSPGWLPRKKYRRWIKEAAGQKSGWKLWPEDARAFSKNSETTGNIFQAAAKAKSAPKSP